MTGYWPVKGDALARKNARRRELRLERIAAGTWVPESQRGLKPRRGRSKADIEAVRLSMEQVSVVDPDDFSVPTSDCRVGL